MSLYVLNKGKTSYNDPSDASYSVSSNGIIVDTRSSTNWSLSSYSISKADNLTSPTGTGIINRHLPSTQTLTDVLENPVNTKSFQLKLPVGQTLTLDPLYDYFVVIYSTETFDTNNFETHKNKIHVAKITEQIQFDSPNDAFEFSPKTKVDNVKGIKYAIYKGHLKTDTNVVAVGFGLLGNSVTGRYFGKLTISTPAVYFYNDRLKIKNQLDYSTKYALKKINSTESELTTHFVTESNSSARVVDKSPFTYYVNLVDNLKQKDSISNTGISTESDLTAMGTDATYTVDLTTWNTCFKNIRRGLSDTFASYTGPSRYITYANSSEINNFMPFVLDLDLSKTINKVGSFGQIKLVDTSKILDEKINACLETLGNDFDNKEYAFKDSIAVMRNLDLVISCDTSIAHLAGTLNVPNWIALKYVPDWRWQLVRNDSPWYASTKLFRQPEWGDWDTVFDQMRTIIKKEFLI